MIKNNIVIIKNQDYLYVINIRHSYKIRTSFNKLAKKIYVLTLT